MGLLLIPALALIFLEGKLILHQHSYICKLVGARAELKEENARLREVTENVVLKID